MGDDRADSRTDEVGERNRSVAVALREDSRPRRDLEPGFRNDAGERGRADDAGHVFAPAQEPAGQESEERTVEARQSAIHGELRLAQPNRAGDRRSGDRQRGQHVRTRFTFAQPAED